jgi:hypothetical protein
MCEVQEVTFCQKVLILELLSGSSRLVEAFVKCFGGRGGEGAFCVRFEAGSAFEADALPGFSEGKGVEPFLSLGFFGTSSSKGIRER